MIEGYASHETGGLNDFQFVASLHVDHVHIDPDHITSAIAIQPDRVHRCGERRRTRGGELLAGTYEQHYWTARLAISPAHGVVEFLDELLDRRFSNALDLFREIDDTGGSVCLFIGLFASRCCDFEIPAVTMRRLGEAGISLRLDYYFRPEEESRAES